jgi:hypothetical protein
MDPFDEAPIRRLLIPMWIAWLVLLGAIHLMESPFEGHDGLGMRPGGQEAPGGAAPHFQPAAGIAIPTTPPASPFTPAPVLAPFAPTVPTPLGEAPGVVQPQAPSTQLPVPPILAPAIPSSLGLPPGAFAPAQPILNLGLASGGPPTQILSPGAPLVLGFSMGPTTLLNQFAQVPVVPFGQVGFPPGTYAPGFGSITGRQVNPFSPTCNYYFFVNCGASGGLTQQFGYSSR